MAEFDLIRRLQQIICVKPPANSLFPLIGIGDDGAVLEVPPGMQLVVSTDTLVEGTHFHPGVSPADLGHKALAVNLSDLAAMGASPAWFFLALTLPDHDSLWLDEFAGGLARLADESGIILAGGDTTSGPLSVTITVMGLVEKGRALLRSGAKDEDLVVVSGTLGDAAYALRALASSDEASRTKLDRPTPRLELGRRLQGIASSCIDISDGLLADLGHILQASGKGAEIELEHLPYSASLGALADADRLELQTAGGDDYELCFTVPAAHEPGLVLITKETGVPLTVIGKITASGGLRCKTRDGADYHAEKTGYQHFSTRGKSDR